jgi:hypothetical protein
MKIKTERYSDGINRLPKEGQHIIGHQQDNQIVVYQAYNNHIADYAIQNQTLGGTHFSYNRMSWIKPNFLWMMYRSGWASKQNQERVLATWMNTDDLEEILQQAVFSSFNPTYYESKEEWKKELNQKEVRLQWDPDHDPAGRKLARRAIQIGMKGSVLETFANRQIKRIEDITEFIKEQKAHLDEGNPDKLLVPVETVYIPADESLRTRIGIT